MFSFDYSRAICFKTEGKGVVCSLEKKFHNFKIPSRRNKRYELCLVKDIKVEGGKGMMSNLEKGPTLYR